MNRVLADEVSVVRGGRTVVDRASLTMTNGVLSIIGPNGSGKTSLLEVVSGRLRPASGETIATRNSRAELARQVGYVPQHLSQPDGRTCRQFVRY